ASSYELWLKGLGAKKGEDPGAAAEGQLVGLLSQIQRKELKAIGETDAEYLALTLDSFRNNTSLVLNFRYRGASMLFTGDAQWGSWLGWADTDLGKRI